MSTSAISQFCQQIPLCEGAKTALTANPKVALLAAIGVVGITLVARRVLCSTPSPEGGDHTGRILERRGSVIIHDVPSDASAESMESPDPVKKPSDTFSIHDIPKEIENAGADSSRVVHSAKDVKSGVVDRKSALFPAARYGDLRTRNNPLPRRFSTSLVRIGTDMSKRFGILTTSNMFNTTHGNAPLDFHFLRNSHPCIIAMEECVFHSASVAILAMQFPENMNSFEKLDIEGAIECARTNKKLIRKDWADVRDKVMFEVLQAKFTQNASFKEKLLATGDNYLIYQGSPRDGFQDEEGGNKLGEILMKIRGDLGGTGIVERPEEEPPPLLPMPKPILKPPGSKSSGVSRAVRWFLPKRK